METARFDALTRFFSTRQSRRAGLLTLLGAALLGQPLDGGAKPKSKRKRKGKDRDRTKRRNTRKPRPLAPGQATPAGDAVAAEAADCLSPGPSSNMNGCNFAGEDFAGIDLSSSAMRGTIFRGANLACADLSSSQLRNADFRGADLTSADLHSSGCVGIKTNAATTFCGTIMCNGSINNRDCPAGPEGQVCCGVAECAERVCHQLVDCDPPDCVYTPVVEESGPGCPDPRICCRNAQGNPGCCPEGITRCTANGLCSCETPQDCARSEVCCGGRCELPVWAIQTTFGGQGGGADQFNAPQNVAVSGDGQTLWVADLGNDRISVWIRSGNTWAHQTNFGQFGTNPDQLREPRGVAVSGDGKTVWVVTLADPILEGRISVWSRSSATSTDWAHQTIFGTFFLPRGVAVTGDGQTVWVADTGNDRISVWTRSGSTWVHQTTFGSEGGGNDQFRSPDGVDASGDGQTLWVADSQNDRISVWTRQPNGSWAPLTTFGNGPGGNNDQFNNPAQVAVTGNGQTVWVADDDNNRIAVWRQSGPTWTPLRSFGSNQLRAPRGVAVSDDEQTIWVSERDNHRVSVWRFGCPAT